MRVFRGPHFNAPFKRVLHGGNLVAYELQDNSLSRIRKGAKAVNWASSVRVIDFLRAAVTATERAVAVLGVIVRVGGD